MKAVVLHDIGVFRVEDVPKPSPSMGEVLVHIRASGICGSDIPRVFTKGTYHFPCIPGHEFAGEVEALGEGVDAQWLGKRVAVFPLLPCRKCDCCQIGEYASCSDYDYFGSRRDGAFAEYLAVPLWNLVEIPDSLSLEEAAMAEPAAVAVHALRRVGIEIGDTVAVFGAGPIGLMLAQWSLAWGAYRVILVDVDAAKIRFARECGFEHVIDAGQGDAVAAVRELCPRGVDVAIEGAGVSQTLEQCLFAVRPFGRVVAMGNPAGDMRLTQKGYWELLRKQLRLEGTWNSSYAPLPKNDWKLALEAMGMGKIQAGKFITHRVSLDEAPAALEMMKERKTFFNKVMFII